MRIALLLVAVTFAAAPVAAQDQQPQKIRRRPNMISLAEIEQVHERLGNAMELIQRLRPQFLRSRGASSFGNNASGRTTPFAKVVVDGVPRGELEALRQVSAMTIREVRYLNAADAMTRFGTGYDGGAIVISTR